MALILFAFLVGGGMPGEGQLAFASARDDLDIYLLDIARRLRINLTDTPANEYQPAWSPDGRQIAYIADLDGSRKIYAQRVGCDGSFGSCVRDLTQITWDDSIDIDPAWSPDGRRIAFVTNRFAYTEIFVTDTAGRNTRRLTNNQWLDADPAWSPDGQSIAFVSDRDNRWNADLYLMDARGDNVRKLLSTPDSESSPAWSPDGRRIVFTTSGTSQRQLSVLDLDDMAAPPLVIGFGSPDTADWSPDGHSIAFAAFRQGNAEIYIYRLDCTAPPDSCLRRVTFHMPLDVSPRWRPTGR
jgi:Tol biopolymer transport system component